MPTLVAVAEKGTAFEDDIEVERGVAVPAAPQSPVVVLEAAITFAVVVLGRSAETQIREQVALDLDIDIGEHAERVRNVAIPATGPAAVALGEWTVVEPPKVVFGGKVRLVPVFGTVRALAEPEAA